MSSLTPSIFFTEDADLAQRITAYVRPMTEVRLASKLAGVHRLLAQGQPTLLLLDLRMPEAHELLTASAAESPVVIIGFGVPRSEPVFDAEDAGVFATLDVDSDRQRVQGHVARALEHLRLSEENVLLRESAVSAKAPVDRPPRAHGSLRLPQFSHAIKSMNNLSTLLDEIVEGITTSLTVSRAGIFLRTDRDDGFSFRSGLRCLEETAALEYSDRDPLVQWLEVHAHMVYRGNLDHIEPRKDRLLLKRALDAFGAEAIVPMHARGRMIGWLLVGHRATGLPFEYEDLEDLLAITEHSAIILENALLYDEVTVQKTLAETVLQSMPTGMVAVDTEGNVRWFNRAAELILGIEADHVLGEPVEALGTQMSDVLRRSLTEPTTASEPRQWVDARTGRSLSAETRPLSDGIQGMGAVALVQDLTAEEHLRVKEEEVERAVFWTELAASMSHEIRNPLVAIKTFAQLLPERYDDPEFREQFSHLVTAEVDRLNGIIEQINDFAHPPALEFDEVHIDGAINKGLEEALEKLQKNGVKIDSSVPRNLPPIHGDPSALTECFAHVITNAMEASLKGKNPRVVVSAEPVRGSNGTPPGVSITVTDNGDGMPEALREKVFSPFCTTKARGMGLGLPIARRTVIDHNGQVDIRTGKKGTAVTITLPTTNGKGNGNGNGGNGNGNGSSSGNGNAHEAHSHH